MRGRSTQLKKKKIKYILKISILLIASLICIKCKSQFESKLHRYVVQNEKDKVVNWKQEWEYNWDNKWNLDSANINSIDHFKEGCALYWTKTEKEFEIKRIDAFSLNGEIYWAHEERILNDTLHCRGGVYLFKEGKINYKRMVYFSRTEVVKNVFDEFDPKILYYEIEIFKEGKHVSTYQSNHNQLHLSENKEGFKLQSTPKDLKLVFGEDILKRKKTE